jgi:hypothetical protein
MATPGYIQALVGGLPADIKAALQKIGEYILGNLKLGHPEHQTRATNLQAYWVTGRTHVTPGAEFSIVHGLEQPPYLAVPVIDLQAVGSATVALQVTRAADANRIYLTSSVSDAPIALLIEAP